VPANDLLEQFAPESDTTWWAVVEANYTPQAFLLRTTDSGRHWKDVSPAQGLVASSYFLGPDVAWLESGSFEPPVTESLYRTVDGGNSWQQLATIPSDCELDFVDVLHGWCTVLAAAAGSEGVELFRTVDGGLSWSQVSYTTFVPGESTPHSLPYGCDKAITFTSSVRGWASTSCNGGQSLVYRTDDGGADWYPLAPIPLPAGSSGQGEYLGVPAADGQDVAVEVATGPQGGPGPGPTSVAVSRDDGVVWTVRAVPGSPELWNVDLIDPTHWRLDDGATFLSTDDGGASWRSSTPRVEMKGPMGIPLGLDFLSGLVGFAVPGANGGPLWWTVDGGASWKRVVIQAGPT